MTLELTFKNEELITPKKEERKHQLSEPGTFKYFLSYMYMCVHIHMCVCIGIVIHIDSIYNNVHTNIYAYVCIYDKVLSNDANSYFLQFILIFNI